MKIEVVWKTYRVTPVTRGPWPKNMCGEMTTYLTKRGKVATLLFAVVALCFGVSVLMGWMYLVTDGRHFQSTYGMHVNRAYEFSDAGMIRDSLELALNGIEELGLEPDDSYRVLWFTDTKFSRVQTEILEIESVILATEQVIDWLEDMHGPSTTKEIGTDIYNVKLENIRGMVSKIDDHQYRIQRAWIINARRNWMMYYWLPWMGLAFLIPAAIALFSGDCTKAGMGSEELVAFKKANKLFFW